MCYKGLDRAIAPREIAQVRTILEQWVKSDGQVLSSEIEEIIARITGSSLFGNGYHYGFLRSADGYIIGLGGLRLPEERMMEYSTTDGKTLELVNLFLDESLHGKGLGRHLLTQLLLYAKQLGYTEVIWNSGPRYEDTAWDFYNRVVGQPCGMIPDCYGPGRDAPVWRVNLEEFFGKV